MRTSSRFALFSLMALATLTVATSAQTAARRPNVVLIVSDDQGYNDLGVTNKELITPALDRLAQEGVRLTSFYVTWPACTPSRGSLLTGRFPQRNGIYDMIRNEAPDYGHKYSAAEYENTFERIGGMDVREILLPRLLKRAGYRSAIFGKWDLGIHRRYLPLARGWDEFYGFVNTGIDYFTHERYGVPSMYRDNTSTTEDKGTYASELFGREALRFIRQNKDRPFFLYLPFNAPHVASSLDPKVRGAAQAPETFKKMYPALLAKAGYVDKEIRGKKSVGPNFQKKVLEYRASITAMDLEIGKVLDLLDELSLAKDTIVVFLSDNGGSGEADNRPLRGHKGQVFEGGIRVCALMRYPGRIPAGRVSDAFVTSMDLVPTLTKAVGVKTPRGHVFDGVDMLPVLAGKKPSPRQEMFWKRRDREAARVGNWKWVRVASEVSLFDLSKDIGETNNLVTEMPQKVAEMQKAFERWTKQMAAADPREPFRDF